MRPTVRRLAPLALACCALLAPAGASASSTPKQLKTAISQGVAYLRTQQQSDGGFAGFGGEWALSALAAAKLAPADVEPSGGSTDAASWYRESIGDPSTWPGGASPPVSNFEDAALAAYAAGIDPARVSQSQNLIAQIAARYDQSEPGYYGEPTAFSGTVFGLLALEDTSVGAKQRVPPALLEQSVEVLRRNQHSDGGWSYRRAEGSPSTLAAASEPDETGAAIAALCGASVPSSDPAIASAVSYLETDLKAEASGSGAFAAQFGANTDSNAWAVQGLDACGIDPQGAQFTTNQGKTPLDFLRSQQLAAGGFVYEAGESSPSLYSSQDAIRALAGAGFTAKPAKPASGPKWLKDEEFSSSASVASELTLVIDSGTAPLQVCAVSIAPGAAKTTLASVLRAAQSASTPSGCVTSFLPAEGKGAITQLDGAPGTPSESWLVSIDGGKEKLAKASSVVQLGDTIYLRSTSVPKQVDVRIEGKSETLFEGPIEAEGHDVQASSDTQPRPCDGTNNGQHATPGPTPTSASVDGMSIAGETFDGQWYAGFDDYFIKRWGPDAETGSASWGVLVNFVFTSVGGCQYELSEGDESLWVYNAFVGRPILALYPADYSGAKIALTATAELDKPFTVEVDETSEGGEGTPPDAPERGGFKQFEGADVAPVTTNAKGFEKVETASAATVRTDPQGKASITFAEPGWHRIKATVPASAGGEEKAVRSNRIDVCVPASGQSGCGAEPAEDEVRVPSYLAG
ncbi:MAG TPA: hypothetical protein VH081_01025 [Solirubrobacteraceae bacterium]|jgi:hypothetical protein|nr:hypothetical protein [Solirubrobacteraceae bacterium]